MNSCLALSDNRQKFSGKEDQSTVAGSTLPYLDFGARMYDPKLVRWNTYDPMAEKYYGINPYVYCAGDPVNNVDSEGQEWREYGKTISVSLNFHSSLNLSPKQIDDYKRAIQHQFNQTISLSSGGVFGGQVVFYENNPDLVQSLILDSYADNSIGGSTTIMTSLVNAYGKNGQLLSPEEVALSAVHEMLHTLRLDHPFENTQTSDTELFRVGPNDYVTSNKTDPNIVNNIMNYSSIRINGHTGTNMQYLTPGQFSFIRNEIKLQNQGYGFIKYNPAISNSENMLNYKKYYEDYWFKIPGTPVKSQ